MNKPPLGNLFTAVLGLAAAVTTLFFLTAVTVQAQPNYTHDATATSSQLSGKPGVYYVTAEEADFHNKTMTIGIPSVAKQTLANKPTKESPAIIMGAAVNYETKVPGKVEYKTIPGRTLQSPYSKFRYKIMDEKGQDGKIHKKLSGFDKSYYIIRIDMTKLLAKYLNGNNGNGYYLHVKQESNSALMACLGMEEKKEGGNYTSGNFADGTGKKTETYSLRNDAAVLKDNGSGTPYFDVIVYSSGKLAAGADAGQKDAPSADVKLSFYVDQTATYNNLTYDAANIPTFPKTIDGVYYADELTWNKALFGKFYDDSRAKNNNETLYTVKGSDLEIDVACDDTGDESFKNPDYWSLENAIYYPSYNNHTIRLICEVPVLTGLEISGSKDNKRNVILDVNSLDIQIANSSDQKKAGLTVRDNAVLTLKDNTKTSGAELAIGNNANLHVQYGGTIIIDRSCQLEVEFDAATVLEGETAPALNQGHIVVYPGGRLVNYGVINVEGMEAKAVENVQNGQKVQPREVKKATMLIQRLGVLDNYGCLSIKGSLYCRGTINNYGKYNDVIEAGDPDKGTIPYHMGIQVTWKDDVTQPHVEPGDLNVGKDVGDTIPADDPEMTIPEGGVLNNYGDIVLVPGVFNLYGTLNNTAAPGAGDGYKGHLYLCAVDEAVIPIIPSQQAPTVVEKRVSLKTPVQSYFNTGKDSVVNNEGVIGEAKVEIVSNGVLGKLTPVTYTVKFDTAGGSTIADQKVESGMKVKKPADPTKAKCIFAGWFKDAECKTAWDFDKDTVMPNPTNKTVTLYAKWTGDPNSVLVTKIKIKGMSHKIAAGKKIRLTAKITPNNAANKAVKWSSNNKKLATVNSKGVVKIKKKKGGKTVIIKATAKDGSRKSATYKIKIMKGQVKRIKIKGVKSPMKVGQTIKLKPTFRTSPTHSVSKKVQWITSNPDYATVSKDGKVTALPGGKGQTVFITARATDGSNKEKSVKIRIK